MAESPARRLTKSTSLISNIELEKALDWLRDNAQAIGDAKTRAVRAVHMLKHVEALEFKLSDGKSAEAKKCDARTSARYMAAVEEDAVAAGEYEKMKALREAASLKIEAWRSEQANWRALKV
jgi:hypothetical protein